MLMLTRLSIQLSSSTKFGLIVFAYVMGIGLFLQLAVLPFWLPQMHAGNGLLKGLDSIFFHRIAVELAQRIRDQGWHVWRLHFGGQSPIGIASAIYALSLPKPWAILPFNSFVHSVAAVIVMKILTRFSTSEKAALLGASMFAFLPSSLIWVVQLHKDGVTFLGFFIMLYGWLKYSDFAEGTSSRPVPSLLMILLGLFIVWVGRPSMVILAFCGSIFVAGIIIGRILINGYRRGAVNFGAIILCLSVLPFFIPLSDINEEIPVPRSRTNDQGSLASQHGNEQPRRRTFRWDGESWLPDVADQALETLAYGRLRYSRNSRGWSNMDTEIQFNDLGDIVAYIPRGLEITLFAPFPSDWFSQGRTDSTTLMRLDASFEMMIAYLGLAGVAFGAMLRSWVRRVDFWMVITFCLFIILIQALIVVNIGTLFRFRYGPYTLIMGMGYLYWAHYLDGKLAKRKLMGNS
jgi:hypothetical protein